MIDTLPFREARNGTDAVKITASVPTGFAGSLRGLYSAPLCAAISAIMNNNVNDDTYA